MFNLNVAHLKQESLGLSDPLRVWQFERHIRQLVDGFGITVRWVTNGYGGSKHSERAICTAPIRGDWSYATALHEVGHLVDAEVLRLRAEQLRAKDPTHREGYRLRVEVAAWAWAQRRAIEWTGVMEANKREGLWSYYLGAHLQGRLTNWAQAELLTAIGLTQAEADRRIARYRQEPSTTKQSGASAMREGGELEMAVTAFPGANGPRAYARPEGVGAVIKRMKSWKSQPEPCESCHNAQSVSIVGSRALCRRCADTHRPSRSLSDGGSGGSRLATLERRQRLAVSRL